MLKKRQNPNNRIEKTSWLAAVALLAAVVYLGAFFSQSSLFGFKGEDGQLLPRWIDLSMLLLLEQLLGSTAGNGRFEVGIADRIPILLAGTVWLAVAALIGWPLVRMSGLWKQFSRLESLAISVLGGLALVSTWTLAIGLMGGLHSRWPLAGSVLVWLIVSFWAARKYQSKREIAEIPLSTSTVSVNQALQGNHGGREVASKAEPEIACTAWMDERSVTAITMTGVWLQRLLTLSVCGLGMLYILCSLMTPYEFDVVEYHLQAPKEFAAQGVIAFNEHNIYANMPLGAEMHSLAIMTLIGPGNTDAWWWGGLIGKFIIGSYTLITAILLGSFLDRRLGRSYGWAGAGLLLSAPGNALVANAGLIDSALAAYSLATLVVWNSAWPERRLSACLLVTCVLGGGAAACKYTGFIFTLVPLGAATLVWMLHKQFTIARQLQLVSVGVAGLSLTCLPWLVKNVVQTGNPVYPLAANLFGGLGLDAQRIEQWNAAHRVPIIDGSQFGPAAAFHAVDQLFLSSPFLSPTLIVLTLCGIIAYRTSNSVTRCARLAWLPSFLVIAVWMLVVWWGFTHRIDRFWLPVLPLYAAAAALGVAWIGRNLSVSIANTLVLLSVGYGAFITASGVLGDNRFFVSLADLRVDAGDGDYPGRMNVATLWVNEHLDRRRDKLLLIGEARVFDFEPAIEYATCFNENLAERLLRGQTGDEQRQNLMSVGATHLLIQWSELARYRSPGNYGFSDWPQRSDVDQLLERGVVKRVDWPFPREQVELLEVVP